MTGPREVANWQAKIDDLSAEWGSMHVPSPDLGDWNRLMTVMTSEVGQLRATSQWRSGPRTLLEALGLHHRELALTAGLGWLLDPDGHHGLGSAFLEDFLAALGVPMPAPGPVSIQLEEQRNITRADLVLRCPQVTVLIEAKVWALEQPQQCARLASEWADESPVLVYLTPRGVHPTTAGSSLDEWRTLSWGDVAEAVARAAARSDAAPGVHDYLNTLTHDVGRTR
ncbi:PD-(D/E)XK nuclease family protein [Modestobacter sp. Leaf380]|uniref:PD-(D/E)XK nuclease family protein n=1 Tax=Modestobacter sp. Leaf380 TaxID=1736356 RepID=UPI0006FC9CC7|nr:PD-(D/E)XK nuclease family protein [Modestobacter sp. Leaf380]KQS69274.1 hypothetical protein ASG41_21930 [Modestobacter sp. Leaf380]